MHYLGQKLLGLSLVFCLADVSADEKMAIGSNSVEPFSTANLSEWTVGLVAVLIIIGVVAWFVKRFGGFGVNQAGHLAVVSGISVGHREKVLLLRAGAKHVLIGVAPGRVQTLHTFAEGEIDESRDQSTGLFQQSLRDALTKKESA
ncbi:MAG: flagellar biosynthetic protein FliO [Piscirickettsiaceae bacterium]|nr:MAG: flagellar biosynthetic protein FliO [Piscirickettsiaceae bacterium]PCI67781.1 MAG: flagellar biosynthetic protein FliO [Piscirickettsiaceae bacterium]